MSLKQLSDFEVDERASAAQVLLQDRNFLAAMDDMREEHVATLEKVEVGSLEASSAHAGLKALMMLKARLAAPITEKKMRERTGRTANAR
jgi:hypothetical protein